MTVKNMRRDYILRFLCITSVVASVAVVLNLPLHRMSELEYILLLPSALSVMVLHEVVHFAVIRFFGRWAKITTLLRRGALMVEYDVLTAKEYTYVSLSPLVFIQLPLSVLYVATSSVSVLVIAVLHAMGSIADVFYVIKVALTCRKCTLRLYRENGKVKGYAIVKPNGEETVYLI
ncbi:MAG: DUF3267 domain-containing protein [Desulfurococcaceae archaeon]